ncbi:hypothetical protein N7463_009931 [Penicillium fimorum]|uniref:Fungal N-terminal domain-containing protein n=1 Tax=Penicillium fimorum TaxID=1882269 RepID=A0A9W9XJ24_9EURO|nr:hypothetical protein N7463_009931 [Penicillium fimorum]
MSFGFSVGDIILCSQITYRLFTAATTGRKNAPRDLRELESVLFGLNCSLTQLQRASIIILSRNSNTLDDDAANVAQQLRFMVRSCLQTLGHLERATDKYRATVATPSLLIHDVSTVNFFNSQQLTTQIKTQWRRIMWDLRGESLTQYRPKLESHLNTINLLLNTLIWSATHRIEQDGMRQGKRIEELLHQASQFNNALLHLMPNPSRAVPNSSFELSRGLSSSVSSTFESVLSRLGPVLD